MSGPMCAVTRYDRWEARIERRLQLARGRLIQWRGATAGTRFGVGRGVRILYPSYLEVGDDVTIGDHGYLHCLSEKGVRIGTGSGIDRNLWLHCGGTAADASHGFVYIGRDTYIGCNAVIGAGGGIQIGNHVRVGQSINMHAENHVFRDRARLIRDQGVTYEGITIEDDVWIGSKVTILDGVTVGQGAVIGAGAVVTRSIPEYHVAVGVPARVIGKREMARDP